jgi:hypothetical protein
MRFDTGVLVALAALSHLPAGSGRVLYGFAPSVRDCKNNDTQIHPEP